MKFSYTSLLMFRSIPITTFIDINILTDFFIHSTFYFIVVTIFLYMFALYRDVEKFPNFKETSFTILGAIVLTSILFLTIGIDFRILADETNLLSTSRHLFTEQTLTNITESLHYYHSEKIVTDETAHRPALFATLTALIHFLIGEHWFNGFILNFLVSVVSITIMILFLRERVSWKLGIFAGILLASFPMYALNVTSSGFDALNMLMVGLFYIQLFYFMRQPSGYRVELLLLTALLAASVRYESAVLTVIAITAIILHYKQLKYWKYSFILPILPFLYIPVLLQKIVSANFSNSGDDPSKAFQIDIIFDNFLNMWDFLFDLDQKGFNTQSLVVIAAIIGIFFLFSYLKKNFNIENKWLWQVLVLIIISQMIISLVHFAYYFGDYRLAWINRLVQIQLLWIIPLAALSLLELSKRISMVIVITSLVLLFINGISIAYSNPIGKSLLNYRAFKSVRHFLQDNYELKSTLIINDRSGQYSALGYSALNYSSFNNRKKGIEKNLEQGLFQNIVVVIKYNHNTKSFVYKLPDNFKSQVISSYQLTASTSIQLLELTLKSVK